jgi:hypothetical protein
MGVKARFKKVLYFIFLSRYSNIFLLFLILNFIITFFARPYTLYIFSEKIALHHPLSALAMLIIFLGIRRCLSMQQEKISLSQWIKSSITERWVEIILLFAIITGFVLRISGIGFELEHFVGIDEPAIVEKARAMMERGDFDPLDYGYPGLYFYVQLVVYIFYYIFSLGSGFATSLGNLPLRGFYYWGRFATVLFSTANILLTYKLGKKLYNQKVGLIGALFLTFSFTEIRISQFVRNDVPLEFFCLLAFISFFYLMESPNRRSYILAGLLVGIATGTKYNGILLILPFIIVHLINRKNIKLLSDHIIWGFLFIVIGFFIVSPYSFLRFHDFLQGIKEQAVYYNTTNHFAATSNPALKMSSILFNNGLGALVFILSLAGVSLLFLRFQSRLLVFFSFPLFYFYFFTRYPMVYERNLLPILPFFALSAALFLYISINFFSQKFSFITKKHNSILLCLVIVSLIFPVRAAVVNAYLKNVPSTTDMAKTWINKNLEESSKIIMDRFSPRIDANRFIVTRVDRITPQYYRNKTFLVGYDYIISSEYSITYHFYRYLQLINAFKAQPGKRLGSDIIVYKIPESYRKNLLLSIDLFKAKKGKRALINIGGDDDLFVDKGWNQKESDERMNWRWSEGDFSTILFPVTNLQDMQLVVSLRPYILGQTREQELSLFLNDNFIVKEKISLSRDYRLLSFPIKVKYLQQGINYLRFQYSHTIDLAKFTKGKDKRKVALAYDFIRIKYLE